MNTYLYTVGYMNVSMGLQNSFLPFSSVWPTVGAVSHIFTGLLLYIISLLICVCPILGI